ncbi:MAG: 4-hydroxy-tetrahydrodipicolinate reductase [Bacteroidetes bacterium]|nr:4-hydroxy-tetrahydrodipicolinate reductase [Bacteroidota bacterium]
MHIGIIGYGKMGREIEKSALKKGHSIEFIIDENNKEDLNNNNLKKIDVAIEFTRPVAAFENIRKCLEAKTPVVSGTTGWLAKYNEAVELCRKINGSFLYASNFSIGVNILFHLNATLAKIMNNFEQYDVEINEIHHTAKLDSPSGTAITLADSIIKNVERKKEWKNKQTANKQTLSILSERKDTVPGTHIIKYNSNVDCIELKHEAKSRAGFAHGAIIAAEFIKNKIGVYRMEDVLGI